MKRLAFAFTIATLAAFILASTAQGAQFGLDNFDVTFTEENGSAATQAGSHPFAMTTSFEVESTQGVGRPVPVEVVKDVFIDQIAGFVGNQVAVPPCSTLDFLSIDKTTGHPEVPECANGSAVGKIAVVIAPAVPGPKEAFKSPVYLLEHAPGEAAKLGFWVQGVPVTADIKLSESPPYEIVGVSSNISQLVDLFGAELTLWGVPASPLHDEERGACHEGGKSCPAGTSEIAFLTLPRACAGPLRSSYQIDSWPRPGAYLPNGFPNLADPDWVSGSVLTHDSSGNALGFNGCGRLGFAPSISAKPTSKAAESPTGLDFSLDVSNEGLTNPKGVSNADVSKVEVTLPEGFSVNPSIAEGLNVCSEAQVARETSHSAPGEGCPEESKIGTVEVESPLLGESVTGAIYQAAPYDNPFDSLVALYMVIRNPALGIVVTQPIRVVPDPLTGRLTTIAENLPQLPFSHFRLHFREGTRSPLATPPACGKYDGHDAGHEPVKAVLTPSSGTGPITTTASFEIISGPDGAPCPSGGTPPFHPGLLAGSINNAGGRFSPFNLRLFRSDREQEITHFSIKLPPGITGKLAGIPFCPEASIAAAEAREGAPHGGQEELDHPSCSSASEVGRTLVGSGVGPSLTYVPGRVYLAGPYHGSALSLVAITAAKAGPFDLGTVVIREALRINPETAEVFVDATGSDPIPHIIHGIPVHLRDIRAYVDRPEFVLNPTSCAPTSTASTVLGSGTDFGSEADDQPITVSTRFQAADCASLGFKPHLALKLKGGTKRGGHPALRAILQPRSGDANSSRISVALPHSEFLENAHIKTICTRVQFKAGAGNGAACPKGAIYGTAKAWTPLLSEPLEGPVYLRSSEHPLPDIVLALHGLIDVDAVGRIDSVKGGIRNTFDFVPDAPITKVIVDFAGGKKGLLVNSTDICEGKHKAEVKFIAHNGKKRELGAPLQSSCKKGKGGKRKPGKRTR